MRETSVKLNTYLALARATIIAFENLQGEMRDNERIILRQKGVPDIVIKEKIDEMQVHLDGYVNEMRHNIDTLVKNEEIIVTDFMDGFMDYIRDRANQYIEKKLPKTNLKK